MLRASPSVIGLEIEVDAISASRREYTCGFETICSIVARKAPAVAMIRLAKGHDHPMKHVLSKPATLRKTSQRSEIASIGVITHIWRILSASDSF